MAKIVFRNSSTLVNGIDTTGVSSFKESPLTSLEVDGNFLSLNTNKAELSSPVFIGNPRSSTAAALLTTSSVSSFPSGTTEIITSEWFQSQLQQIAVTGIIPAITATKTQKLDELGNIVPGKFDFTGVDLGSTTHKFANLFVESGIFNTDSIELGDATLSGSAEGGVVLPTNTAIGTSDNVIPANLASTELDFAFASTANTSTLSRTFNSVTSISNTPTFVQLRQDGKVELINTGSPDNDRFIGVATGGTDSNGDVTVTTSGIVSGLTGLSGGSEYYLNTDGTIQTASTATNVKVGKARTATQLFIYSTTSLDLYLLSKNKAELTDFSIGANASPSGAGSLAFNNTTGVFTFTPTKAIVDAELTGIPTAPTAAATTNTTQVATTAFVIQAINDLIDSSPSTLDTLNEIAAAINNDGNFAVTVTNSLGTKAPLADPALTGTPTAPTAASGTNSTQIATTAFVASGLAGVASLNNAALTGVPTAPTATAGTNTTQLATTEYADRAVAQGGGGVNIDGGTATSVRNTTTIALDGGNA